jgi:hypothetical protein
MVRPLHLIGCIVALESVRSVHAFKPARGYDGPTDTLAGLLLPRVWNVVWTILPLPKRKMPGFRTPSIDRSVSSPRRHLIDRDFDQRPIDSRY